MKTYGIDLGTTYSAIAALDDKNLPKIIENFEEGGYLLASAVYFPEDGPPVVGAVAKNFAEIEPERVVQFVKRGIGTSDAKRYDFNDEEYGPIEISSLILKRMVEYAEKQGEKVENVVITCPANFKIERRNATRMAAELIGLNVLNIVNEPTAAALNYCSREYKESRKILVFDLGGGTFDVTLLDFSVDDSGATSIDVIDTDGNDRLGGADWDDRLFEHLCECYCEEIGESREDLDAMLSQEIRNTAEETKKKLTNMESWKVTVARSVRFEVTREKFEELTKDLVTRTVDFISKLLTDTGLGGDDVDLVLLVGGSTKMPMIQRAVEEIFPGKVQIEEPDFAVAKGAAIAASIEFSEHTEKLVENLKRKLLGIQSGGDAGELDEIIKDIEELAPELAQELIGGEDGDDLTVESISEAIDMLVKSIPDAPSNISLPKDKLNSSFGPAVGATVGGVDEFVIDNLLFKGDQSPAEKKETYGTMVDNQEAIRLPIYENLATDRVNTFVTPDIDLQGNAQETDPELNVNKIGELYIPLPHGTPGGSPIEVTFNYSTAGLDVKARNPSTGELFDTFISSANLLSPEAFEETQNRFAAMKTRSDV